jgi:hypothetical protein
VGVSKEIIPTAAQIAAQADRYSYQTPERPDRPALQVSGAFSMRGWQDASDDTLADVIRQELALSPINEVTVRFDPRPVSNLSLPEGTVVKVRGIPVELLQDVPARTHPANVPLITEGDGPTNGVSALDHDYVPRERQ